MPEFEVTETIQRKRKVDVTFPLYRKHYIDSDHHTGTTIYMRVDEQNGKLREVSVTIEGEPYQMSGRERGVSIGIHDGYRFDQSGRAYTLGEGEYASNAGEFGQALATVRKMLDEIAPVHGSFAVAEE